MKKKTITRSELVQTLPRQLSAITFDELCDGREVFDDAEAFDLQQKAEAVALPGKTAVWRAVETAAELIRMHSLDQGGPWRWQHRWGVDGEKAKDLTIEIVDGRAKFTLVVGRDNADHELQHLDIPLDVARALDHVILGKVRDAVRTHEERQDRAKLYEPKTSVETLIKYMPRDLTIGQFMELMGERTSFNPLEVVDIVTAANVMVGIK